MEAAIDGTVNDASLFLVAAGERTAEACHDGGEQVLKAFREFRVEGEPALHQRFRRKLIDVGHHLLLKLVHHRDLHRRDIREPDELAGLEGCAIYLDVYFHVPSWPDFDIGPSAAQWVPLRRGGKDHSRLTILSWERRCSTA